MPNSVNFNAPDRAQLPLNPAWRQDAGPVQAAFDAEDWVSLFACLQNWLRGQPGQPPLDWEALADADRAYVLDLAMHLVRWGDFQARWDVAKLMPIFGEAAIPPLLALLKSERSDSNMSAFNCSDSGSDSGSDIGSDSGSDSHLDQGSGNRSDDHLDNMLTQDGDGDRGDGEPVDPDAQWFAVRILGELHPLQSMKPLIAVLSTTQNSDLQAMAVTVLAQIGAAVINPIGPLLEQPTTRLLATQILAQIPNPQVIPPLMGQIQDPDAAVRAAALEALARFYDDDIPPVLLRALQDPAAAVRRAAVVGLGFNPQRDDWVPHIQPLLLDLNLEVGRQAAQTLGRLGTAAAVEALSQALSAPLLPDELGIDLVRSLVWSKTDRGIAQLGQALHTLPLAAAVQREGCAVLGRVESADRRPQAAAVLRGLLRERRWSPTDRSANLQALQSTIVRALGQLGQSEAIPDLVQLLTTTHPGLRLHIAAALKALDVQVTTIQQLAQAEPPTSPLAQGLAAILQEW